MRFYEALPFCLEGGKRIARSGWNGKGMFLQFQPRVKVNYVRQPEGFAARGRVELVASGEYYVQEECIVMFTADKRWVPWLCSQTDMLAYDWEVIDG